MSNASDTIKAAQNRASVWSDGKRRVSVAQRASFRHNNQTITKLTTEVIEDPHTIALLEEHGIELIELQVNGRPKKGQFLAADADRVKNIDELAKALGIMPNLLHAAIESGKPADVEQFLRALESLTHDAFQKRINEIYEARVKRAGLIDPADNDAMEAAGYVKSGKVMIDLNPQATLDDAIGLLDAYEDPHSAAVAFGAKTILAELRGHSRPPNSDELGAPVVNLKLVGGPGSAEVPPDDNDTPSDDKLTGKE
jgi:hypothetical protein